ncbi:hypothetical protein BH11PSE4_BH11PSE4_25230 [soil metagenome]
MAKKFPPIHPGEVLREEFLIPLKMSPGALANVCGIPRTRIERLASETGNVTADTALRLGRALNTSAQFWFNLQNAFDMQTAEFEIGRELAKIKPVTNTTRRREFHVSAPTTPAPTRAAGWRDRAIVSR